MHSDVFIIICNFNFILQWRFGPIKLFLNEVSVPSQWSCICLLGVSISPFYDLLLDFGIVLTLLYFVFRFIAYYLARYYSNWTINTSVRRVWRYQRGNQNPYIEEEQTTQVQKDKQRSAKHTYKTKDRVTRTPLKSGVELGCSGRVSSSCSTSDTRRVNLVTNLVITVCNKTRKFKVKRYLSYLRW